MVLYELHDNAMHYMDRDEWNKALILLQKAQIIIEVRPNSAAEPASEPSTRFLCHATAASEHREVQEGPHAHHTHLPQHCRVLLEVTPFRFTLCALA